MDRNKQLEIFKAQTANLRVLEKAWTHTKRGIHANLLTNNLSSVEIQTKVLALIYCAWSETAFSKLVHTPHGFTLDEIKQIKLIAEKKSIVAAWQKCVFLALRKIKSRNGSYIPNIKQTLNRLITKYIEEPSQLRNKVAHGQWLIALNSKGTDINQDLTLSLEKIDLVKLDLLRESCIGLCNIIEVLIESPERAFHRDYEKLVLQIKSRLDSASKFTLADKISMLKEKRAYTKNVILHSN